jgi:perosamine synthetase
MNNKTLAEISNYIIKFCGKPPISLSQPEIKKEDIKTVLKELKNKNVGLGKYNFLFQKKISNITRSKNIILVSSGTCGLFACLKCFNISTGNEVLLPSFNYIAAANSIIACNADPHFVDSSINTLGVDYENLEKYLRKISIFKNRKLINIKTKKIIKALIITHVFGHSEDMQKAKKFCKKFGLILIEDATEALGSYFKKKHLGTIGDAGVLSFNGNKIITTGGGGAIIVKSRKRFNLIKKFVNNGKVENKSELLFDQFGLNFKMPNLNAALGYSQINNLKKFIYKRRKLFTKYDSIKSQSFSIIKEPNCGKSNYWLQGLRLKKDKNKKKLVSFLLKKKIHVRSSWKPNHLFKHLNKYPRMEMVNCIKLYNSIINLPSNIK